MIEINLYRCRIGTFSQKIRDKKSAFINRFDRADQARKGENALAFLQSFLKLLLILCLLSSRSYHQIKPPGLNSHCYHGQADGHSQVGVLAQWSQPRLVDGRDLKINFWARYTNGNRQNQKGIKSLHLNIRSLVNKVCEVKHLVQEHSPHIFGLSECELKKIDGKFDERRLKVPGYDLIFPQITGKTWVG